MYKLSPCVIVLSGPPLTGKSWLAEGLASEFSLLHLDLDEIRQELFPNPELKLLGSHQERFVVAMSYAELTKRAYACVEQGRGVILTGTFSRQEFKAPLEVLFYALVEMGVPLHVFRLAVPSDQEIERRIAKRQAEGGPSNINTLERFKWSLGFFQPIGFVRVVEINTERPIMECIEQVYQDVVLGI